MVLRAAFYKLASLGNTRDAESRRTIQLLSEAYLKLLPQLRDAYSCVAPLYACAKLDYWEGDLAAAMMDRLDADGLMEKAKPQEHSILWWSVSGAPQQMVVRASAVLQASAAWLLRRAAEDLKSQEWSNVLLACARLQYGKDPALLHHVTSCIALAPPQGWNAQGLANTLYSLGKLAEDCSHSPKPRDLQLLSRGISACLEAGSGDAQNQARTKGPRGFLPQELANMLTGCFKLGYANPSLLGPLAVAAGSAARRMTTQELCNALHSLAKLGCGDSVHDSAVRQLLAEWELRVREARHVGPQRVPYGLVPEDLTQALLALERLRPPDCDKHVAMLSELCLRHRFSGFGAREISNSIWPLAKMASAAPRRRWPQGQALYAAAVQAYLQPEVAAGAGMQCWSNLLYGLALVGHRPSDGLLPLMAERFGEERGRLEPLRACPWSQHCANILWALATLGMYDQRLVDVLLAGLDDLLVGGVAPIGGQEQANTLWALAVMGPEVLRRHSDLVGRLLQKAVTRWEESQGQPEGEGAFRAIELPQLWQACLELDEVTKGGLDVGGSAGLKAVTARAFERNTQESLIMAARRETIASQRETTSHFQRDVLSAVLRLMGRDDVAGSRTDSSNISDSNDSSNINNNSGNRGSNLKRGRRSGHADDVVVAVGSESLVEALGCRVDILVELASGRRVAIEADGPLHFLANWPYLQTRGGSTRIRDRQLRRVFGAGNVVSVPHWEWARLRSEDDRLHYLRRKLALAAR